MKVARDVSGFAGPPQAKTASSSSSEVPANALVTVSPSGSNGCPGRLDLTYYGVIICGARIPDDDFRTSARGSNATATAAHTRIRQ